MDDHKMKQMGSTLKFLTRHAQEGDEFLDSTVTGDEIWVFHHTPESKQVTAMASYTFPQNPEIQKTSISVKKNHGVHFLGQKRHSPSRLHASWLNN